MHVRQMLAGVQSLCKGEGDLSGYALPKSSVRAVLSPSPTSNQQGPYII